MSGWASRSKQAIIDGTAEVGVPTLLSTLAICIVFVPVFLLQGTAKYLFSPLSLSVIISLLASLVLSFTLVPVLFKYLMRVAARSSTASAAARMQHRHARRRMNPFSCIHYALRAAASNAFAKSTAIRWPGRCDRPLPTVGFFAAADRRVRCLLFPQLGMDFFPQVDAGQMRLHVRAPAGHAASRRRRRISPRSSRRSARSSATIRSTSCSTISACPTAASTSR